MRKDVYGTDSEQVKTTSIQLCKLCNMISMAYMDNENFPLA